MDEIAKKESGRTLFVASAALGGVVLVGFLVYTALLWVADMSPSSPASSKTEEDTTAIVNFMDTNSAYNAGELLRRQGDVNGALLKFEKARAEAQSLAEESQVDFVIAQTQSVENPAQAIALFKDIVANPEYGSVIKAAAIDFMGVMYRSSADAELVGLIFSGKPYEGFLKNAGGNVDLAFISLLEYGVSLNSRAGAELRLVDLYINELVRIMGLDTPKDLYAAKVIDEELWDSYVTKIRERVRNADASIARMRTSARVDGRFPSALTQRAAVIGKIYPLSMKDPDLLLGSPDEAEELFQESFAYSRKHGLLSTEGFAIFNYAAFLERFYSQYGPERDEDIRKLLSEFYKDDRLYAHTTLLDFLSRSEGSADGNLYMVFRTKSMERLARVDPKFKQFLNGHGWNFE